MKKTIRNIDLMIYNFVILILLIGIGFYMIFFIMDKLKNVVAKKPISKRGAIYFDIKGAKKLNLVK